MKWVYLRVSKPLTNNKIMSSVGAITPTQGDSNVWLNITHYSAIYGYILGWVLLVVVQAQFTVN